MSGRDQGTVYDEVYGGALRPGFSRPRGLLWLLNKIFGRFSIDRVDAALRLLSPGTRLLDVGCGDGDLLLAAKGMFEEVYGVDISSVRLKRAREKASKRPDGDKIHLLLHDVEEGLPFPDGFFDAITCIAVLEHLVNPPYVLSEMNRVLKRGGRLIIQVPNIAFLPNRLRLLLGKLPTTGYVDDVGVDWLHLHSFTPEVLVKLLNKMGFTVAKLACSGVLAGIRRYGLSLLASDVVVLAIKRRSLPPRFREILKINPLARLGGVGTVVQHTKS